MKRIKLYSENGLFASFELNDEVDYYMTPDSISIGKCSIVWKKASLSNVNGDIYITGEFNNFKVKGLKKVKK